MHWLENINKKVIQRNNTIPEESDLYAETEMFEIKLLLKVLQWEVCYTDFVSIKYDTMYNLKKCSKCEKQHSRLSESVLRNVSDIWQCIFWLNIWDMFVVNIQLYKCNAVIKVLNLNTNCHKKMCLWWMCKVVFKLTFMSGDKSP